MGNLASINSKLSKYLCIYHILRWVLSPFWNSYMYRVREKERRKLQQSAEWNSTNFLCYQSVTSWAILWLIILLYYDSTWICRTSDGVNCYKGIKSNHVFQIRQFCSFIHLNLSGDCKSHCLLCKSYWAHSSKLSHNT